MSAHSCANLTDVLKNDCTSCLFTVNPFAHNGPEERDFVQDAITYDSKRVLDVLIERRDQCISNVDVLNIVGYIGRALHAQRAYILGRLYRFFAEHQAADVRYITRATHLADMHVRQFIIYADPSIVNERQTHSLLHQLAWAYDVETIEMVLALGSNLLDACITNMTPVLQTITPSAHEVLKTFVRLGARSLRTGVLSRHDAGFYMGRMDLRYSDVWFSLCNEQPIEYTAKQRLAIRHQVHFSETTAQRLAVYIARILRSPIKR